MTVKGITDNDVFVSFGGNLGGETAVEQRFCQVLDLLCEWHWVDATSLRVSSLYRSKAVGPIKDQPDFLNMVATFKGEPTLLPSAQSILKQLLSLEQRLGRTRKGPPKGPRTIDLDLLFVGTQQSADNAPLQIPHPQAHKRAFVLLPLQELCGSDFVLPRIGQSIEECLAHPELQGQEIERINTTLSSR